MELSIKRSVATIKKEPTESVDYLSFLNQYLRSTNTYKVRDYRTKKFSSVSENVPLYTSHPSHISFPSGLVSLLPLQMYKVEVTDDSDYYLETNISSDNIQSVKDEIRDILPQYPLRDDQVLAVFKSLTNHRGIIQMPTSSGKTTIMAALLKYLINHNSDDVHALIIAPTNTIVTGIYNTMRESGIDVSYYKDDPELTHDVTVAHPKGLLNKINNSSYDPIISKVNVVLYDEVHHMTNDTYQGVAKACTNAEFSIGLSAKVIREEVLQSKSIKDYNYQETVVIGYTGPVIMYVPPKQYITTGILATPVILRVDNSSIDNLPKNSTDDWHALSNYVINGPTRSLYSSLATQIFHNHSRKVLVLVNQINQAYNLANIMIKLGINPLQIGLSFGGNQGYRILGSYPKDLEAEESKGYYTDVSGTEIFNDFNAGNFSILIATSHMDEGADIKYLDVCVLACGGKNAKRVIQRVGRALRPTKSGRYAYIVDFTDSGSGVLSYHSKLRTDIYTGELGTPNDRLITLRIDELESQFKSLEDSDPTQGNDSVSS